MDPSGKPQVEMLSTRSAGHWAPRQVATRAARTAVPAQRRAVPADLVLLAAVPAAAAEPAALELELAVALGQAAQPAARMAAALVVPEPVVPQAAAVPEVDKKSLATEVALLSSWSMASAKYSRALVVTTASHQL